MNQSPARLFLRKLNGPWHKGANLVLIGIVLGHWVEHLMQAFQVYGLKQPPLHAHGAIGFLSPWLVTSEWLHFAYVVGILAGLALLQQGFTGRSRVWWNAALAIQGWHAVEHSLLLAQAMLGHNLFGAAAPTSLAQLVIPRLELHLFYNGIGLIPMVMGFWSHLRPPAGERRAFCRCARLSFGWARASLRPANQ
jgi:hypothetical protein